MEKYTTILKLTGLLSLEIRKASELKLKGFSSGQIKVKVLTENIFQVNTESRKREIASTILRRIEVLDDWLLAKIISSHLETVKHVSLYSVLKTDQLFFEFMSEVYRDKILLKDFNINNKDFSIFFDRKAEQNEQIASWKDYTFYKLKQVYKRVLCEAGFAKRNKKETTITPPIIEKDVIEHLRQKGEQVYLKAMLGEI